MFIINWADITNSNKNVKINKLFNFYIKNINNTGAMDVKYKKNFIDFITSKNLLNFIKI